VKRIDGDSTLNDERSSSTQIKTEPEITDIDDSIQINGDFARSQDDDDTSGKSEDNSDHDGENEGSESALKDIETDLDFIDGNSMEHHKAKER
jgi:hypothetical protein